MKPPTRHFFTLWFSKILLHSSSFKGLRKHKYLSKKSLKLFTIKSHHTFIECCSLYGSNKESAKSILKKGKFRPIQKTRFRCFTRHENLFLYITILQMCGIFCNIAYNIRWFFKYRFLNHWILITLIFIFETALQKSNIFSFKA